jgi:hypothetical protein
MHFFSNPFLSPLIVNDVGVNKQLTPVYDLTSDASAWPVSTGLTETNGKPRSRTFSWQSTQRSLINNRTG